MCGRRAAPAEPHLGWLTLGKDQAKNRRIGNALPQGPPHDCRKADFHLFISIGYVSWAGTRLAWRGGSGRVGTGRFRPDRRRRPRASRTSSTSRGVRQNQLIGYGLVVGLKGTGDTINNSPFTRQLLTAMLDRLGANIGGQTFAQRERRRRHGHRQPAGVFDPGHPHRRDRLGAWAMPRSTANRRPRPTALRTMSANNPLPSEIRENVARGSFMS